MSLKTYLFGKEVNLVFFNCEPTVENMRKAPPTAPTVPKDTFQLTPAKKGTFEVLGNPSGLTKLPTPVKTSSSSSNTSVSSRQSKAVKSVRVFIQGSIELRIDTVKNRQTKLDRDMEPLLGPTLSKAQKDYLKKQAKYLEDLAVYTAKYGDYVEHEMNNCFFIDTSRPGPKPDITLSLKMLPGNLAYEMHLTIANYVPNIDLRKFTYVLIEAGYTNMRANDLLYQKRIFVMKVFHVDVRSPNPDGEVTLLGVEVTRIGDTLSNQPIHVFFNDFEGKRMSFKELVEGIYNNTGGLKGIDYEYVMHLDEWYKGVPVGDSDHAMITINEPDKTFNDIHGLVRWFQDICDAMVAMRKNHAKTEEAKKLMKDERIQVLLMPATKDGAKKTTIFFVSTHFQENLPKEEIDPRFGRIVYIDKMYTAPSFQASWCTIKAPWNPNVQPDCLIAFSTKFWEGSEATNILVPEDMFISRMGIYRVITMELNFASASDTNEMTINCIQYEQTDPERAKQFKEYIRKTTKDYYKDTDEERYVKYPIREIHFGKKRILPEVREFNKLTTLKGITPLGYITTKGEHYITREGRAQSPEDHCTADDDAAGLSQIAGKLYPTQYINPAFLDGFEDFDYYVDDKGVYQLRKIKYEKGGKDWPSMQGGYMWPLIYGLTQIHKGMLYKNVPFCVDDTSADNLKADWAVAYTKEETWYGFLKANPTAKNDFIKLLEAGAELIKNRFIGKVYSEHNYKTARDDFPGYRGMKMLAYSIKKMSAKDIETTGEYISKVIYKGGAL